MSVARHIFLLQMTRGVSRRFHHVTLGLPNCSKGPVPAWPTNEILPWKTFCFRRKRTTRRNLSCVGLPGANAAQLQAIELHLSFD
jgi:hypothetical protein